MTLKILNSGTLRNIQSLKFKDNGIVRTMKTLKLMDNGTLRTIAVFVQPMSVTVSPSEADGYKSTVKAETVYTNYVSASISGGQSPFSYSWVIATGTGITISSPTSPTVNFSKYMPTNVGSFGSATLTVTDALGSTATKSVPISFNAF